jgi:hypothetical protein
MIDEIRRYTIAEDGKRIYSKSLSTIRHLLTDSTLSNPLRDADNLIDVLKETDMIMEVATKPMREARV